MRARINSYYEDGHRYWVYEVWEGDRVLYHRAGFSSWEHACESLRLQWPLVQYKQRVGR